MKFRYFLILPVVIAISCMATFTGKEFNTVELFDTGEPSAVQTELILVTNYFQDYTNRPLHRIYDVALECRIGKPFQSEYESCSQFIDSMVVVDSIIFKFPNTEENLILFPGDTAYVDSLKLRRIWFEVLRVEEGERVLRYLRVNDSILAFEAIVPYRTLGTNTADTMRLTLEKRVFEYRDQAP